MAEIFGPIGFCFGGIGFVLSTIPNARKAVYTFEECADQFRGYKTRLAVCKAESAKWEILWRRKSDFGKHETTINMTKSNIERLQITIENEIQNNMKDITESRTWQKTKEWLLGRSRQRPGDRDARSVSNFVHSVGYALYKKDIIEGWVTTLEKAIDSINKLSEREFERRTAEHPSATPNRHQILELEELEDFVRGLTSLAQRLHDERTATATGSGPTTYAWGLGLRPPPIDVEHWKYIAEVHIELRYSVFQAAHEDKHFHLHVPFHKENQRTHLKPEQIKQLVSGPMAPNGSVNIAGTTAKRSVQHAHARRTRPIGDLLKEMPTVFLDRAWRADRAVLIQGISHWALLLWDTPWMAKLCCYGLQLEKGVSQKDCIKQIFNVDECPVHSGCYHGSRLRNIGLVLAQLLLGIPIRRASDSDHKEYQQWTNGNWEIIYRSDIIAKVFTTTTSVPLCDAVRFCLNDDTALANDHFQPGFLLKCIEHLYKPLNEWYRTETQSLRYRAERESKISDVLRGEEWPERAMCQVREPRSLQHPPSGRTHPIAGLRALAYSLIWKDHDTWPLTARYLLGIILSTAAIISLFSQDIPLAKTWANKEREGWSVAR